MGDKEAVQLEEMGKHTSMFKCAIYAKDSKDEAKLKSALNLLTKEDPSIVIWVFIYRLLARMRKLAKPSLPHWVSFSWRF